MKIFIFDNKKNDVNEIKFNDNEKGYIYNNIEEMDKMAGYGWKLSYNMYNIRQKIPQIIKSNYEGLKENQFFKRDNAHIIVISLRDFKTKKHIGHIDIKIENKDLYIDFVEVMPNFQNKKICSKLFNLIFFYLINNNIIYDCISLKYACNSPYMILKYNEIFNNQGYFFNYLTNDINILNIETLHNKYYLKYLEWFKN